MNLAVPFRAQLQNAGQVGVAALRNLEDALQKLTQWGASEHNVDGTHAAVTATSLAVSGLLSADRYKAKKTVVWDYAADASGVIKGPGVVGAGLIVFSDTTPGAGGVARSLYAIDATGRTGGEIVWFININGNTAPGGTDFSQIASATNRQGFPGFANFTGVIGATRNIPANRLIPLIYLNKESVGVDIGWPSHPWFIGAPL